MILTVLLLMGTLSSSPAISESFLYVPDQLIVRFNSVAGIRTESTILSAFPEEIKAVQPLPELNCTLIETHPQVNLVTFGNRLLAEKWCSKVSLNYYARLREKIPNDPEFPYQYALKNSGQFVYPPATAENYSGRSGADIKATKGWDWTVGSETIIVAVIDTGVLLNHEDLQSKIGSGGKNFLEETELPVDDHGHGTEVSSIIAADTDNGIGMAGVCWLAKIMPIKVFNSQNQADSKAIALAIRYAAENGAQIINMSFTLEEDIFYIKEACKYAYEEKQCVLVAATGDSKQEGVLYPAAYDQYCIAVGATDANDQLWTQSNYGAQTDVVAPGAHILCATIDKDKPTNMRTYTRKSGTSYATAMVSGAVALLKSYKPGLTNIQIRQLLQYTADDVNQATLKGKDKYMGYGRINLETLLSPYLLTKPDAELPES